LNIPYRSRDLRSKTFVLTTQLLTTQLLSTKEAELPKVEYYHFIIIQDISSVV